MGLNGAIHAAALIPLLSPAMRIAEYEQLRTEHAAGTQRLKKRYNAISNYRGLLALVFAAGIYFYFREEEPWILATLVFVVAGFVVLMRKHDAITWRMEFSKTLLAICEDELSHVKMRRSPFRNGAEFVDPGHAYTFDLDIFGNASLYQHLNRTATHSGGAALAATLMTRLPDQEILRTQEAVKELASKVRLRHEVYALARMAKDGPDDHKGLLEWSEREVGKLPAYVEVLAILGPAAWVLSLILYTVNGDQLFLNAAGVIFFFNLGVFVKQVKRIKTEMTRGDAMHRTIRSYAAILERIEREHYESDLLRSLKAALDDGSGPVHVQVNKLSRILANMDSMHSGIGAILFNGSLLFHVNNLRTLLKWRRVHTAHIPVWLEVMGRFEALSSLANFTHNEPLIAWPELNVRHHIHFSDAGHPMIDPAVRVNNDITFDTHRFTILSGSNMSGKSTFLRTLGVNMVLAGSGATVCASKANIHPMDVLVSMRSTDSLSEGESYFFAEVKRLSGIMQRLDKEVCFVLLDEILRGTNSDDKRNGTIEVIRRLVAKKAIGMIATHDLEVCATTEEFPEVLMNKCFEVQVVNDALHFDHKLRDGVSQNRSATFLLRKMGII